MNFLENELSKYYDSACVAKIISGLKSKRTSSFRVNTIKTTVDAVLQELDNNNISYTQVGVYDKAFLVEDLVSLQNLDIYKNGFIYVQNVSSMLPPLVLKPQAKDTILDMCASPGGKTTQIATITDNLASITACEMNNIRIEKLKYNVNLQGAKSVYVMNADARNLDSFYSFDKILLDAPCSGSGTLDLSNDNYTKYFTPKLVEKSVKSQQALLKKAVSILKKGGTLVYSTCSVLKAENEAVLESVLKDGSVVLEPIDKAMFLDIPLLPSLEHTITVCPSEVYEGFFVAKLKKIK